MCRIFLAKPSKLSLSNIDMSKLLKSFADLSVVGHLPCGITGGHKDGFGFAFVSNTDKHIIKSPRPILEDTIIYSQIENKIKSLNGEEVVLGHLRAATHGGQDLVNTHPFENSNLIMVHNGSIDKRLDEPFAHLKVKCKGDTDTERMLAKVSEYNLGGLNAKSSYIKMLEDIVNDYPEYRSAISVVVDTGDIKPKAYGVRLYNPNLKEVGMDNYYSLYIGKDEYGGFYLCSEALPIPEITWKILKNGEMYEISEQRIIQSMIFQD